MISRRRAQPPLAAAWRQTSRRSTTSSPTTSLRQIIQDLDNLFRLILGNLLYRSKSQSQLPQHQRSTSMQEKVKNLTSKEEEQCALSLWGNWIKVIIMVLGSGPTSADSAFHRQNLQEEVDILLICEIPSKIMKNHCENNIYDNSKALYQLNKAGKAHGTNRLQRFAKNCRFWI